MLPQAQQTPSNTKHKLHTQRSERADSEAPEGGGWTALYTLAHSELKSHSTIASCTQQARAHAHQHVHSDTHAVAGRVKGCGAVMDTVKVVLHMYSSTEESVSLECSMRGWLAAD